jgi:hypothetical protein
MARGRQVEMNPQDGTGPGLPAAALTVGHIECAVPGMLAPPERPCLVMRCHSFQGLVSTSGYNIGTIHPMLEFFASCIVNSEYAQIS